MDISGNEPGQEPGNEPGCEAVGSGEEPLHTIHLERVETGGWHSVKMPELQPGDLFREIPMGSCSNSDAGVIYRVEGQPFTTPDPKGKATWGISVQPFVRKDISMDFDRDKARRRLENVFRADKIQALEEIYSQPHRIYHDFDHILFMASVDHFLSNAVSPELLIKSIAYHDVCYDDVPRPMGHNEYLSALFAEEQGCGRAVGHAIISTAFYMADQARLSEMSPLSAELCDLDLANLALHPYQQTAGWFDRSLNESEIFMRSSGDVSAEASAMRGQVSFCAAMLRKRVIYFRHVEWEDRARENLVKRMTELEVRLSKFHKV